MNTATLPPQLQAADMALAIADEACRVEIECKARPVPSNYPQPVYDTRELEDVYVDEPELLQSYREDVERAVRYLDLRGQIVRPFSDAPHLVSMLPGVA